MILLSNYKYTFTQLFILFRQLFILFTLLIGFFQQFQESILVTFIKPKMRKSITKAFQFVSLKQKTFCWVSSAVNSHYQSKIQGDAIFIRHGHSQFNKACQDFRTKHQIDYDWNKLCKYPGFEDKVAYNPIYFDCPLTTLGKEQCYLTSQNVHLNDFDVILVSPHQRALETCANILKYVKSEIGSPKIIVEPLVAGSLWSSCDISKSIYQKIKQYQSFDFSRMLKQSQLWFLDHLRVEDQQKVYSQISRRKLKSFKDKQLLILEMIRNHDIEQNSQTLRGRAWQIKKKMKKLKQRHGNILIISHYYIIQYVNTRSFNQKDNTPTDNVDLKNCYPYYNNIDSLFKNQ